MRHPRQARHHHAQGHAAGAPHPRLESVGVGGGGREGRRERAEIEGRGGVKLAQGRGPRAAIEERGGGEVLWRDGDSAGGREGDSAGGRGGGRSRGGTGGEVPFFVITSNYNSCF